MAVPSWDREVGNWLSHHGLQRLDEVFAAHNVTFDVLVDLTEADLSEMGFVLGDRKQLLRALAALKRERETGADAGLLNAPAYARVGRRQLSVLFCDLVNFTSLANQLDPEDLNDILHQYWACNRDVISRWGGYLAQYMADGVMSYFGWPRAGENDAEAAVRAAIDLCAEVGRLRTGTGTRLLARSAVATGLVMAGELIGEGDARQNTVIGSTPSLAARLQTLAEPGAVVVSPTTRQLVKRRFDFLDLGEHRLKGFAAPTRAWQVERARSAADRFSAEARSSRESLTGRKQQLRVLRKLWEKVGTGRLQAALIVGEAGIGKTRLLQQFQQDVRGDAPLVFTSHCSPFHAHTALHPFVESISHIAGITFADGSQERLKKIESLIQTFHLNAEAAPRIASILSVAAGDRHSSAVLGGPNRRDKSIAIILELIAGLAGAAPFLLIVEDLHWADPTTLEVLDRLIDGNGERAMMIAITTRPGSEGSLRTRPPITQVRLKQLSRASSQEMVLRIAKDTEIPEHIMGAILTAAAGVPLFVEELTRNVIEAMPGRKTAAGTVQALDIPATLIESITAKLDRLASAKDLAQICATIGKGFSLPLLSRVAGVPERELRAPLALLCQAGILVTRGIGRKREYVFRHALIQEVAYRMLLNARRRELHLSVARNLERHFPEQATAMPEVLAHHLNEGGANIAASGYYLAASKKAARVAATSEAIAQIEKGLALVEPLPPSELRDLALMRLHAMKGTALMHLKGWGAAEVERAYSAAANFSPTAADPSEAVWLLWGIWVYRHVCGHISRAAVICDRIRELASGESSALRLVSDMISLQTSFYSGCFDETTLALCRSVESRCNADALALIDLYSMDVRLVAVVHHSIVVWILGRQSDALHLAVYGESLVREISHPYTTAWTLAWGTLPHVLSDKIEYSTRRLAEASAIAEDRGFAYIVALVKMLQGYLRGRSGGLEQGIGEMRAGLNAFQATGAGIAVPFFKTLLAELTARAGNLAEALALLEDAETQQAAWGETWALPELHRVRGHILAHAAPPDFEAARASYRRSIEIARLQRARGWRNRARLGLETKTVP